MAYPYLPSPHRTEDDFRRWFGDYFTNTASGSGITYELAPSQREYPKVKIESPPSFTLSTELYSAMKCYTPKKIIRNGPATIVFWPDGSKTVVKRAEGEEDNTYSAFCAALAIKIFGSNSKLKKTIKNLTEEQE